MRLDAAETRQLTVLSNAMVEAINAAHMTDPTLSDGVTLSAVVAVLASIIGGSSETREEAWQKAEFAVQLLEGTVEVVALKAEMHAKIEEMRAKAC